MAVSVRHVLSQGPVLRALAGVALGDVLPGGKRFPAEVPGSWIEAELPPRPARLVRDFVTAMGGKPEAYGASLPAMLFPQWTLPLATRALAALPYPLTRALNLGCRVQQLRPLPAGEALQVKARLLSVDDDGQRAVITTQVVTATASAPHALLAELRAYLPLARRDKGSGKAPVLVPHDARLLETLPLAPDAGLDFAKLTGDFNPIHWIPAAGRAAGFGGCILHGFATLARAIEVANRALLGGDPTRLAVVDARFTRPLPLPARVGVYARPGELWVGEAPGATAFLQAQVELTRG